MSKVDQSVVNMASRVRSSDHGCWNEMKIPCYTPL